MSQATVRPLSSAGPAWLVQRRLEAGVLQTRRPKQPLTVKPVSEGRRPHLFHFDVSATLPEPLRGLARLARNLWWSWDREATALFEELSPRSWDSCGHNPVSFLQRVYPEDVAARSADPCPSVARRGRRSSNRPRTRSRRSSKGRAAAPCPRRCPSQVCCAR